MAKDESTSPAPRSGAGDHTAPPGGPPGLHQVASAKLGLVISGPFIAGALGGCSGVVVGHPFDTIKVLQQTASGSSNKTIIKCFQDTLKYEGPRGFFKGMAFPFLSAGFLNSLIFGIHARAMHILSKRHSDDQKRNINYTDIFVAGMVAGGLQAVPACPIELVKVKLQSQTARATYKGPFDCLLKIYKAQGVRGAFRGLNATILREIPGLSVYITSDAFIRKSLSDAADGSEPIPVLLFAGGTAGVLSWLVNIPIDVVKSQIQSDSLTDPKYRGFIHCARSLYAVGGWRVFVRGLTVICVRAFPVNAVTLAVINYTQPMLTRHL